MPFTDLKIIEVEKVFYRCMISAFLLVAQKKSEGWNDWKFSGVDRAFSFALIFSLSYVAYEMLFGEKENLQCHSASTDEGSLGQKSFWRYFRFI